MLVKEPKEKGKAPCMILFCEFEQQFKFIELGKKYGLPNYINLVFRKDFSAQVRTCRRCETDGYRNENRR
jgi:site-specific DNA-methyltransferase (adenine-specific)